MIMLNINSPSRLVAGFLGALIVSFATLVPGGLIETRDFSHLDPIVFWGFNAFLIGLAIGGLGTLYFLWKNSRQAYKFAIAIAWLYIVVFILDWAQVFPVSSDSMSVALCGIEIFGAVCCAYVIAFSHKALGHF